VSRKGPWKTGHLRWVVAGVTAVLWLFTGFLSASPAWHHWFHNDSQSAQHHCLVSKYSEGDFLNSPAPTISENPKSEIRNAKLSPEIFEFSQPANLLPPGRAPPVI